MNLDIPYTIRNTAGTVVLKQDKGLKVLVIRRVFKDGSEDYTFPKGGIDEGESVQDCAIRETLEETGYKIKLIEFLDSFEFTLEAADKKSGTFRRSYFFLAELEDDKQFEISHPDETEDILWINVDEAKEKLSFPDYKRVLELAVSKR